ncbi:MAG: hypothetical protein V7609_71 [Verrucomicrobiota bacterium]
MPATPITAKQLADFQKELASLQEELRAHTEHLTRMRAADPAGTTLHPEMEAKPGTPEIKLGDLFGQNIELQKQLEIKLATAESRLGELSAQNLALQKQFETKLNSAESKVGELSAKNIELQKKLDAISQSRPRIGVETLLEQFRNNLDGINKAVTEAGSGEKRGVVVDQMEVEVKGGLELEGGIQLTQLHPQEVTPASVSTIRFSLRPASTIKIVEEA